MSDTTPTPADVAQKPAQADGDAPEPKTDEVDWKAEARKWEQRAKDNKAAADRLAELEQTQMTEAEKVEARVRAAEDKAAALEAANARKDVAIEYGLSKDDAALLEGVTDADTMRRIAERLAADMKRNNYVPDEGATPRAVPDERAAFADFLTGHRTA